MGAEDEDDDDDYQGYGGYQAFNGGGGGGGGGMGDRMEMDTNSTVEMFNRASISSGGLPFGLPMGGDSWGAAPPPPPPLEIWKNVKPFHTDIDWIDDAESDDDDDDSDNEEGRRPSVSTSHGKFYCYFCSYGQYDHDIENNRHHLAFMKFMREQHRTMSVIEYTTEGQKYYNLFIRPCIELDPEDPKYVAYRMKKKTIHEHFTKHILDVHYTTYDMARTLHCACTIMSENEMFEQEQKTKKKRVNPSALRRYLETLKYLNPLLKQLAADKHSSML